jgi:hypothetical protein
MQIKLSIEKVHIENLCLPSGLVGQSDYEPVLSQLIAGASPEGLRDIGYTGIADEIEEPVVITPDEQDDLDRAKADSYSLDQEDIDLIARATYLRNLVFNVDKARKREGFQTNHERMPKHRKKLETRQAEAMQRASESLDRACGVCALRETCALVGSYDKWVDAHPYKSHNGGRKRPGSSRKEPVESRYNFLKGLAANPAIHCDPMTRKKK